MNRIHFAFVEVTMNRQSPISPKGAFKNGVLAALEIRDVNRAQESGLDPTPNAGGEVRGAPERTAAIVDAEARKLNAKDFTALETVCASHVLALDAIFNAFARDAAGSDHYLSRPSMATALRAQGQCRMTLKTLLAMEAQKKSQNPANGLLNETNSDADQSLGQEARREGEPSAGRAAPAATEG